MKIISNKKYSISQHNSLKHIYFLDNETHCIGGIDREFPSGNIIATISAPYDEETGSDVQVVYSGDDVAEAIAELWDNKERAEQ